MRLRSLKWIAAAACALPLASQADGFSYRYVDLAHLPDADVDADNLDVNGDGLQVRGSLPVYQNFFVTAELLSMDLDNGADVTRLAVGGGGHWPVNPTVDFIARGGFVNYDVEIGNFDDDDTGLFLSGRLRTTIMPKLELEGGIEYYNVEVAGLDDDTYFIGEGRYNITPQLSAGVLFTIGGDTDLFGVQGRLNF